MDTVLRGFLTRNLPLVADRIRITLTEDGKNDHDRISCIDRDRTVGRSVCLVVFVSGSVRHNGGRLFARGLE